MKALFLSAAAIATVAIAPALAQTTAPAVGAPGHKVTTRAEMIQKVQQHFARMDANNDGFVTKAEAETARSTMREHGGQRMERRGGATFDRMDANKDGSISRAEFDAVHQKRAGQMGKGARMGDHMGHSGMSGRMFEMADSNNDGRVSLQEATAAAAAHFDRADVNRDGTLTHDEMRAAHRAMRSATNR